MAFLEELHAYDAPLEHCHSLLPGLYYAQPPPATEWPSGVRLRQIRSRLEVSAPELVSRYAEFAESSHVDAAWKCAQAEAKHERGEPLGKHAKYVEESYDDALHMQDEFAEIARIFLYDSAWDRLFPEEDATS